MKMYSVMGSQYDFSLTNQQIEFGCPGIFLLPDDIKLKYSSIISVRNEGEDVKALIMA
jgi:hypothetical protein